MSRWKSIVPTENQEAIALIQWVKTKPLIKDYFIHIPNEGKRTFHSAVLLKRAGLMPGVSDYFLAYPCGRLHGLWLELKRKKNSSVTKTQKIWLDKMRSIDYEAKIAYGFDQAVSIINEYMKQDSKWGA